MKHSSIVKTVQQWAAVKGIDMARNKLIVAGLSPRFAEQFLSGTYKHRLYQSTLGKLRRAGAIR